MNGQMMNYRKSLNSAILPIMPSELPKIRIDYTGLLAYAKSKGVRVIELSEEERERFAYPEDESEAQ